MRKKEILLSDYGIPHFVRNDVVSTGKWLGGLGGGEAAAQPSQLTLTICHSERSEESLPGLLENTDLN